MRKRAACLHSTSAIAVGAFSIFGMAATAEARITNIVITAKTSPAFGGMSFGTVGQYEQLDGTASGEIDPKDPRNAVIQDIELTPRNSRDGRVFDGLLHCQTARHQPRQSHDSLRCCEPRQ